MWPLVKKRTARKAPNFYAPTGEETDTALLRSWYIQLTHRGRVSHREKRSGPATDFSPEGGRVSYNLKRLFTLKNQTLAA